MLVGDPVVMTASRVVWRSHSENAWSPLPLVVFLPGNVRSMATSGVVFEELGLAVLGWHIASFHVELATVREPMLGECDSELYAQRQCFFFKNWPN